MQYALYSSVYIHRRTEPGPLPPTAGGPGSIAGTMNSRATCQTQLEPSMKIAVFSAQPYDRQFLEERFLRDGSAQLAERVYHAVPLTMSTLALAQQCQAVSVFVNDQLDAAVLGALSQMGVGAILMRCTGFNNLDTAAAARLGLFVARVPAYSPEAVAEHTLALILTLNRHTHQAYARVRDGNFALEGLIGSNLHGKTVGLVGVGKIGMAAARIFNGFGCHVLGCDPLVPAGFEQIGSMATLPALLAASDIVSLPPAAVDAPHDRQRSVSEHEKRRDAGQHLARWPGRYARRDRRP